MSNVGKCKILHIDINDNPGYSYAVDGIELAKCENDQEKDLGVITSTSLLWHDQIKASICKANQMICWIARNVICRDHTTMLAIYKTLIRPHVENCVQLWNPVAEFGNWQLILALEGVQRRFTRLIDKIGMLPYSQRLDVLKLTTLAERRNRGDLIETFKAMHELSSNGNLFRVSRYGLKLISDVNVTRGNLKVQRLSKSFLSNRVIKLWNQLPSNVRMSESVDKFKDNLEKFKTDNKNISKCYNFWDISTEVLARIEDASYLRNKSAHNKFLNQHPFAAKKQFINLHT